MAWECPGIESRRSRIDELIFGYDAYRPGNWSLMSYSINEQENEVKGAVFFRWYFSWHCSHQVETRSAPSGHFISVRISKSNGSLEAMWHRLHKLVKASQKQPGVFKQFILHTFWWRLLKPNFCSPWRTKVQYKADSTSKFILGRECDTQLNVYKRCDKCILQENGCFG